ncbi:MAG: ERF family protein [Desulfuromonadales bacterium]|nr:ERF family protein [Desulfuromonadales bacterium]
MSKKNELTRQNHQQMTVHEARPVTPMDLIQQANGAGASIEKMEQLFALQLRWEENEAKKAYHRAVAAFKSETIHIVKDKKVGYTNRDGSFTGYTHATLGNIVQTIIPIMGKHGLSHSWNVEQSGGTISVTCRLAHELGHSTSVMLAAAKDDSGKKNAIQQVASTITYLERYTLLAITGLATADQDDDAKESEAPTVQLVDEEQLANIDAMISETGADVEAFCKYLRVEKVTDIPAAHYEAAIRALEKKRKEPKQ